MRRIELTVTPDGRVPVPYSDGYSLYAALLAALDDVDASVSARVHDAPFGSLHTSGLLGTFGTTDREHHKLLLPDRQYEIALGVVDPGDQDVFEALVTALVFDGDTLELTDGTISVDAFESRRVSREDLLAEAGEYDDPSLSVDFRSPTCIEERGAVTTMFPHRGAVFASLLGAWNRSLPDDADHLELDLTRETVEANVIEKPNPQSYHTHSVLVNRFEDDDGETRPEFRQGFTAECVYEFKNATESVRNAVTTLALFGELGGVGSAVSRGCGHISVEVSER
jgi:hypothetical protein